jgi:protoporphyrinogen oxidase
MTDKRAIIIGAGPAGLTAAIELQRQSAIKPILIEASQEIGGISRTVRYKGNRMDIGGHRFFSKSDRVMRWWLDMMPVEAGARAGAGSDADLGAGSDADADGSQAGQLRYRGRQRDLPQPTTAPDPRREDLVMLVRPRRSRIYFLRRFFDYPISLKAATFRNLGLVRTLRCGLSYMRAALLPQGEEKTLEDFIIHRFGRQLYLTFFKSYTEKVWGVPCSEISAEWGAQRIKGLSLRGVVAHFFKKTFAPRASLDIAQKQTETSLIEKFLYPKLGPGQLWEHAAELVRGAGGEIHQGIQIDRVSTNAASVLLFQATTLSPRCRSATWSAPSPPRSRARCLLMWSRLPRA